LQIEERSSTGTKGIKRSAGVVDSGYRGEIKIAIMNCTRKQLVFSNLDEEEFFNKYKNFNKDDTVVYNTRKAIAQGVIHRVEEMNEKEISYNELLKIESKRGDKGWGSSNK
jgi:dUTPase